MAMTKRVQIPIDQAELDLYRAAADRAGLPLAEWARRHLREVALQVSVEAPVTPQEAVRELCAMNLPTPPLAQMIRESFDDRYK